MKAFEKCIIIILEGINMYNTDYQNAKEALKLTTLLTLLVAGYEAFRSSLCYKEGMNFLDIASFANADLDTYCLVLILANIILLPNAVLLYKQSNINLKNEIFEKNSLIKDVFLGIILAVVSAIIGLLSLISRTGRTDMAFTGWEKLSTDSVILMVISLGFVSGICKEIFFRGFAKNFVGKILGEQKALLLFNIMFGMLDWFNIGYSFIVGLLWIWGYNKSKHLIVPMIAHGGVNLISVVFYIITT